MEMIALGIVHMCDALLLTYYIVRLWQDEAPIAFRVAMVVLAILSFCIGICILTIGICRAC